MEFKLEEAPTCLALGRDGWMVIGAIDGSLQAKMIDITKRKITDGWRFQMNASIRDVIFDHDYSQLFCISRNKAVCSYDFETGKRTRCIVKGTTDRPNVICLFPATARKHQQFATGDEAGQVRTWDFRAQNPLICEWKEQETDINALAMDSRHNLLSASSDGSLAAYEVRKCKLRMKSETMHSELLSLCVTSKYVYAGGIDGAIEVFTHGEYGNLLERIESGFDMGVNQIVQLRSGLLLTASEASSDLRMLNVMPSKRLGIVGSHGDQDEGVDKLQKTPGNDMLVSVSGMASSIKAWPLAKILEGVPILRADNIQKRKQIVKEGFFDDLAGEISKKKKISANVDESNDSDENDDDEESGEENSSSGEGGSDEADSDEDMEVEIDEEMEEEEEEEEEESSEES